jgi:hypothetical protein
MKRNQLIGLVILFLVLIIIAAISLLIAVKKPIKGDEEKMFCPEEQADFCTEIYQPACGWFDPEKIQCIKYPCAQTFSNGCYACKDDRVLYWTDGECPQ